MQVSATVKSNVPLFNVINFSVTGSYSGTVYDLYNVTVREIRHYTQTYEYFEYGYRTRYSESNWSEIGDNRTEQAQVPRIITYSRDSLY